MWMTVRRIVNDAPIYVIAERVQYYNTGGRLIADSSIGAQYLAALRGFAEQLYRAAQVPRRSERI
jgi:hypothetical protein